MINKEFESLKHKIIKHRPDSRVARIGILGGTFDPIHHAHLHMAEVAREECNLDEVWFIPTKTPPHKQDKQVSSAESRLAMLLLAIEDIPYFSVSLLEYERKQVPSYTIDTMESLVKLYPRYQFYFIIGADMIHYLPQWHRIEQLLTLVTFIGVGRPGWPLDYQLPYLEHVKQIDMIAMDISSTLIRQRIKKGKSIRFLVPEKVYAYIRERRLYE